MSCRIFSDCITKTVIEYMIPSFNQLQLIAMALHRSSPPGFFHFPLQVFTVGRAAECDVQTTGDATTSRRTQRKATGKNFHVQLGIWVKH